MSYSYKRSITINQSQCGGSPSTNFPVKFDSTDADFKSAANGGLVQNVSAGQPCDLAFFTDATLATSAPYELETYDATTGHVVAWFKIPTTASAVPYIAYDDAAIVTYQGNPNAVWSSGFKLVWHLPDGSSLSANDSTSNANNGTITGCTAMAGQIDGAATFGATNYINVASAVVSAYPFSMELNVKLANTTFAFNEDRVAGAIVQKSSSGEQWWFGYCRTGSGPLFIRCVGQHSGASRQANATIGGSADTNWHRLVALFPDDNAWLITYDGVPLSMSYAGAGTVTPASLDNTYAGGYLFNTSSFYQTALGAGDEFRISNIVRSDDWYLTDYNNQFSGTFYTLSSRAPASGARVQIIKV